MSTAPKVDLALGVGCPYCSMPLLTRCTQKRRKKGGSFSYVPTHERRWAALMAERGEDLIRVRIRKYEGWWPIRPGEVVILSPLQGLTTVFFPLVSETTGEDLDGSFLLREEADFLNFIPVR